MEVIRIPVDRVDRTMFLRLLTIALLLNTARGQGKPNVLFLHADDMSWKTVAALSGEDIDTPNLDRLAARGTVFTHAYNSGGWHGAICVASRTMLNTGLQLWRAKVAEKTLERDYIGKNRMWSQLMAAEGYRTCFAGKWHIGGHPKDAFEEVGAYHPGGMPRDGENAYERPIEGRPDPWDAGDPKEGGYWSGGKHWSEVMVDDFQSFLGEGMEERPWFMYLAFNAPHDPRQAPREYLDRYPLERVGLPANFLPVYPYREPMRAPQSLRDERLAPSPRTEHSVKVHRREYYAIVSHLDAQIGRILDMLEQSPDAGNTVIVFTADHGLSCGEHGLLGKQNLYDSSVRVPFIISGPGIPVGKRVGSPVYLQDVMPTTLRLAGAEVPEQVEFRDLAPLWEGKGTPREAAYGSYMDSQRMLVKGGRKLILYPRAKVARVFDLSTDPDELRDLIDTAEGKRVASELFEALLAEQTNLGDPLDLRAVYPDL